MAGELKKIEHYANTHNTRLFYSASSWWFLMDMLWRTQETLDWTFLDVSQPALNIWATALEQIPQQPVLEDQQRYFIHELR